MSRTGEGSCSHNQGSYIYDRNRYCSYCGEAMNRTVEGSVIVNGRYVTEAELAEMVAHRLARLQKNNNRTVAGSDE